MFPPDLYRTAGGECLVVRGGDRKHRRRPGSCAGGSSFRAQAQEDVLSQEPAHRGLLASLSRGFTQYASSFVLQDALEERDRERADAGTDRAKRLLLRAKEYGMRGLEAAHPGFGNRLPADPRGATAMTGREDVPLLFWTAASWSLSISLSGADPHMLADLPRCESLMRR